MSYRDALELPVTSVTDYQAGRRCMMFAIDMLAFHALRGKEPALTFGEWMDSLRNADDALFTARDPLPALSHWGKLLRQRVVPGAALSSAGGQFCVPNKSVKTSSSPSDQLAQVGPVRRG